MRRRLLMVAIWLLVLSCAATRPRNEGGSSTFEAQRRQMVAQQLKARDVTDAEVLRAMETVPRHLFVPASVQHLAYDDGPLPIGEDQTISQPYIVALMTQLVAPKKDHKILEVGTGSGYQAAVLSLLCREVYSIEIVESLGRQAAERLKTLGYANVHTRIGNGYFGWPEAAPFDGIVVTAGATEIPPALVEQLKPGARMIIPVGSGPSLQVLKIVEKDSSGKVRTQDHIPVRFVPLRKQ